MLAARVAHSSFAASEARRRLERRRLRWSWLPWVRRDREVEVRGLEELRDLIGLVVHPSEDGVA